MLGGEDPDQAHGKDPDGGMNPIDEGISGDPTAGGQQVPPHDHLAGRGGDMPAQYAVQEAVDAVAQPRVIARERGLVGVHGQVREEDGPEMGAEKTAAVSHRHDDHVPVLRHTVIAARLAFHGPQRREILGGAVIPADGARVGDQIADAQEPAEAQGSRQGLPGVQDGRGHMRDLFQMFEFIEIPQDQQLHGADDERHAHEGIGVCHKVSVALEGDKDGMQRTQNQSPEECGL